jgi:hypothetical protein
MSTVTSAAGLLLILTLAGCAEDAPKDTRPDFQNVVDSCNTVGKVEDKGATLLLEGAGNESAGGLGFDDFDCVLTELGAPQSVVAAVGQTRALDGRQSSEWDGFEASYTYHPDSGMQMVITKTKAPS